MSPHIDADEIEITRGERLLAAVLAVFLVIGGVWGYVQLNQQDGGGSSSYAQYEQGSSYEQLTPREADVLERREQLALRTAEADRRVRTRRATLTDRREAYRTALDAGQPDPKRQRAYQQAEVRYNAAQRAARRLHAQQREARAAARPAEQRLERLDREQARKAEADAKHQRLVTGLLRLALVLAALAVSLRLLVVLRRRDSRWITVGYGSLGAATVLAVVLAVDYLTDWFDPIALGPVVLSLLGTLATLAALAALQRYLARRLPGQRVRRSQCPFCGFPVHVGGTGASGAHCDGCGRVVVAACTSCETPRRVGTPHCGACGAA